MDYATAYATLRAQFVALLAEIEGLDDATAAAIAAILEVPPEGQVLLELSGVVVGQLEAQPVVARLAHREREQLIEASRPRSCSRRG